MNINRKIAKLHIEESKNLINQTEIDMDSFYKQQQLVTLQKHLELYKQEITEAKKEARFSKIISLISILISIVFGILGLIL